MFTSIVVPLDLTPGGDRGLPVAAALARRAGLPMALVTVSSPNVPEADDQHELRRRAADVAAAAAAAAAAETGAAGGPVTTHILHDNDPAAALVGFLADRPGSLVVMATRARRRLGELLLGSVSEELLTATHHPVLLVGPNALVDEPCGSPTLVAGADGSDLSDALLPALVTWHESFLGPKPWLVEVLPVPREPVDRGDTAESGDVHRMASALARLGVDAEWEVTHGNDPADALGDFADRVADAVLVVASARWTDPHHGHRASVARRLAHEAHQPVLVVQTDPARLGAFR